MTVNKQKAKKRDQDVIQIANDQQKVENNCTGKQSISSQQSVSWKLTTQYMCIVGCQLKHDGCGIRSDIVRNSTLKYTMKFSAKNITYMAQYGVRFRPLDITTVRNLVNVTLCFTFIFNYIWTSQVKSVFIELYRHNMVQTDSNKPSTNQTPNHCLEKIKNETIDISQKTTDKRQTKIMREERERSFISGAP